MKKLTFVFFLISTIASAQIEILSSSQWETKYQKTFFGSERVLSEIDKQEKWKGARQDKLHYNFRVFARENGFRLDTLKERESLMLNYELTPEGKFASVVYRYSEYIIDSADNNFRVRSELIELSKKQHEELVALIRAYCSRYSMNSYSLNSEYFNVSIRGRDESKRKSSTAIKTISEAMNTSRPDTVIKVDFSGLSLKEVPDVLFRFKNVQSLYLSDNEIKMFPRKLWRLKKMKDVDLSKNMLENATFKTKRNKSVEVLNLQYNKLTEMPNSLKKLKRLESLVIGNNNLAGMEKQKFKRFKSLKNLNLYNSELKNFPRDLGKFEKLEEIDVYYNGITTIPPSIGELKNLTTLAVSFNKLWELPEEVGELGKLEKLYAHHNKIEKLPVLNNSVQLLDIGYNYFSQFPSTAMNLSKVKELDISNNRFETVPLEVKAFKNLERLFIGESPTFYSKNESESWEALKLEIENREVLVR